MKRVLGNSFELKRVALFLLFAIGAFWVFLVLLQYSTNVLFWLFFAGALMSGILIGENIIRLIYFLFRGPMVLNFFKNSLLFIGSVMTIVIGCELFLAWKEYKNIQLLNLNKHSVDIPAESRGLDAEFISNIRKRQNLLTLPKEWERRTVDIPGASWAYFWHDALHVHDSNFFRRASSFPLKQEDFIRIMVVGDSLTYGYGIDERFTYSSLLPALLDLPKETEILNLGVSGHQSEDIVQLLRDFLPKLQPDIVFYGVCLNDFLPSEVGQYNSRGFELPLPDNFHQFLIRSSRFSKYFNELYDRTLRAYNFRADFFDDILKDFEGYQQRFRADVKVMNQFVMDQGLPPVLAMVLDQFPAYEGRGYKIAMNAERYLREAGMEVISTEEYYKKFNGRNFTVSRWEGHPNEEAHEIFASMIAPRILDLYMKSKQRKIGL